MRKKMIIIAGICILIVGGFGLMRYQSRGALRADFAKYQVSSNGATSVTNFGVVGDGKTDDTKALQKALNHGGKLYIPKGTYLVSATVAKTVAEKTKRVVLSNGLKLRSHTTLILNAHATLKVIANDSFSSTLLNATNVSDIQIYGGRLQGDRTTHQVKHTYSFHGEPHYAGETGWGILMNGADKVKVAHVRLDHFWGDGIDLLTSNEKNARTNRHIQLKHLTIDHNRRTGIAVESGIDVDMAFNQISDTSGTAPSAGVNLEPSAFKNPKLRLVENVSVRDSTFQHNNGSAIQTYGLGTHTAEFKSGKAQISDVRILDNHISHSNTNAWNVQDGTWDQAFNGQITIVGAKGVYLARNVLTDPDPAGTTGLQKPYAYAANSQPHAGIYIGYSDVSLGDNVLRDQDLVIQGPRSKNYAGRNAKVTISLGNHYRKLVTDPAGPVVSVMSLTQSTAK